MLPLLVNMAKIIKHTFEIPNLTLENGELVEGNPTTITYTFTLLFKGFSLFEEIHGKSLFASMLDMYKDSGDENETARTMFGSSVIKDLAAASYVKIDGDRFHNNRATVEEFRKSPVSQIVENDMSFVAKLTEMASECIYGNLPKHKEDDKEDRPLKK